MTDFPIMRWPPLNLITPYHSESLGDALKSSGGASLSSASSGTFTSDLIYYYQFRIYEPAIAVKLSHLVGSTAAGLVDLGIYDSQGNLLVSTGLIAQGTLNTLQEADITDTLLNPGIYFMAIKCTLSTGTGFRTSRGDEVNLPVVPFYIEVGDLAAVLPTTATMVLSTEDVISLWVMAVHFSTLI